MHAIHFEYNMESAKYSVDVFSSVQTVWKTCHLQFRMPRKLSKFLVRYAVANSNRMPEYGWSSAGRGINNNTNQLIDRLLFDSVSFRRQKCIWQRNLYAAVVDGVKFNIAHYTNRPTKTQLQTNSFSLCCRCVNKILEKSIRSSEKYTRLCSWQVDDVEQPTFRAHQIFIFFPPNWPEIDLYPFFCMEKQFIAWIWGTKKVFVIRSGVKSYTTASDVSGAMTWRGEGKKTTQLSLFPFICRVQRYKSMQASHQQLMITIGWATILNSLNLTVTYNNLLIHYI